MDGVTALATQARAELPPMASAVDKQPAAARPSAVAAADRLPTATRGSQSSYTTSGDITAVAGRRRVAQSHSPQGPSQPAAFCSVPAGQPQAFEGARRRGACLRSARGHGRQADQDHRLGPSTNQGRDNEFGIQRAPVDMAEVESSAHLPIFS